MAKNKIKETKFGLNRKRRDFSKTSSSLALHDLVEIQTNSFGWLVESGLEQVFTDIYPVSSHNGDLTLEYKSLLLKDPKYTIEQAKDNSMTYSKPLYANLRLINSKTGEVKDQEVFFGDFPMMTPKGTFIVNGAERVIVSQLVRSPGAYFQTTAPQQGISNLVGSIIPGRGAWLEFELDAKGVAWARVDKTRKMALTTLLHSMGLSKNDIFKIIGKNYFSNVTWNKSIAEINKMRDNLILKTKDSRAIAQIWDMSDAEIALHVVYDKLRPGEPATLSGAMSLLKNKFFDERRYDLTDAGRNRLKAKFNAASKIMGLFPVEDKTVGGMKISKTEPIENEQIETIVKNISTFASNHKFKIIKEFGETIELHQVKMALDQDGKKVVNIWGINNMSDSRNLEASDIIAAASNFFTSALLVEQVNDRIHNVAFTPKIIGMETWEELDTTDKKAYTMLTNSARDIHFGDVSEDSTKYIKNVSEINFKKVGSVLDDVAYINGYLDDIDNLANRRVRTSGELVQNQFRVGLARIERVIKEKMSTSDTESITPKNITNVRPLTAAIREFFASSQLSQFMDQMNPLSELANKRRISALGPGGLSRDRAGFEVRDVHPSHYGRLCPIETPEGPNIGLINNLSTHAKLDKHGFITTPYRRVTRARKNSVPVVSDEIVYLSAGEEYHKCLGNSKIKLDAEGKITEESGIVARFRGKNIVATRDQIDFVEIAPKQIVSIASACIPFLENDDAIRAAMGANMQRQAVPLVKPEAPIVGTGVEGVAAKYSGMAIVAINAGTVAEVDSTKIVLKNSKGKKEEYDLVKYDISNQGTVINQTPNVKVGDKIKAGDVIADGPSMDDGELALGQNVTVAFMTWNGYNYEDAIIMSERMVKDDVYTSIHLDEYSLECRDTKLGEETITDELPNVSDVSKKWLDTSGIIQVGAEVKEGDILVGKITPRGQVDLSPEEKLLMAIFGDKSKNVKDSSLRVPHGGEGIIHAVKIFRREDGHKLSPGVNVVVKVQIIQRRKIKEGDKMAGRHGNKGVISRILPVEDMPMLPDGTAVDIMLNPLGVPSRMNIGQVLELHLGMAAKKIGCHVASSVFDGATNEELFDIMKEAGMDEDAKVQLVDGKTGEKFEEKTSVGVMYMVKLAHMVDDKLHARSTGPYSLITQQPLGGKAQKGGQRFGEMEVWALEAYGAAHTLQEILTIKSDDIVGRTKAYEAIIKDNSLPEAGIPESFRVLQKELQSLAINVKLKDNGVQVNNQVEEKVDRSEKTTEE